MTLGQIKRALTDYDEIVNIVNDFKGSFNDLFRMLNGHNLDLKNTTFDVNYKSICASVYTDLGCYYVSGDIEVYDDEKGTATRMFVSEMREVIQKAEDNEYGACIGEYLMARNKVQDKCRDYLRAVLKDRTKKMLDFTDSLSVFADGVWHECHSIVLDNCDIVRLDLGHGNTWTIYDLDIDSTLKLWSKVKNMVPSAQKQQEPIEVRIKFSASVYIKGKTMREIKEKWENCLLLAEDTDDVFHEFGERLLVEDAKTYKDLSKEFDD